MVHSKGKVTLISVDEYGPSLGIRFLSSVLKKNGYTTTVIFAPGKVSKEIALGKAQFFSKKVQEDILELAKGSLFVGLSVVTPTFFKAKEITAYLRMESDIPIIWGGVHATTMTKECLEHADMVCYGEGEDLLVTLSDRVLNNKPLSNIPGLILRENPESTTGSLVDITRLPRPDYDFNENHYLATNHEVLKFNAECYEKTLGVDYFLASTRGCPYKCTYCINSNYAESFKGRNRFRQRDLDLMIRELSFVKTNIPSVQRIIIDDDCFMAIKEEDMISFANRYRDQISLPFVIRGAHPQNVTDKKIKVLCEAGLIKLRIGIQTGSDRIRKLYDRLWENNQKIIELAKLVSKYIESGELKYVMYDIITDNPWETEDDCRQTLDLVLSLPRPFGMYLFSLTFYPGTDITTRALKDNKIKEEKCLDAYWSHYGALNTTPINSVLTLMLLLPLPSSFIRFLSVKRSSSISLLAGRLVINFLHKIISTFPELSLFFKTKTRYETDFLIKYKRDKARKNVQGTFNRMADINILSINRVIRNSIIIRAIRYMLWIVYVRFV